MKVECPKCFNSFMSQIFDITNIENAHISGNIYSETCTNCGYTFNPNMNGNYKIVDGVPYLINELNELNLSKRVISRIQRTPFENIKSEEVLLDKARFLDISLYEKIKSFLKNGVVFATIILALIQFKSNLDKSKSEIYQASRNIVESIHRATLIPNSAKKSLIDSISKNGKINEISTPETREIDKIDDGNLIRKLDE